jgi:hypothetical protein
MHFTRIFAPVAALAALASAPAMDQGGSSYGGSQSGSSSSQIDQQQLQKLSQLPQAGQRAVLMEAVEHEGKITDVDRKSASGGQTYYTARLQNQDHDWTVKLSEQGQIVQILPHPTQWESVPQTVQQAALKELQQFAQSGGGQSSSSGGSSSGSQGSSSMGGSSSGSQGSSSGSSSGGSQSSTSSLGGSSGGSQSGSSSQSEGKAKITQITTIRRNGQIAYRFDLEMQGQGRDVVIGSDGQKLPTQNPQAEQQVQQLLMQVQQSGSQSGSSSNSSGGSSSR